MSYIGESAGVTGTKASLAFKGEAYSSPVTSEAMIVFVDTKSAVHRWPSHRYDSDLSAVAVVLLCLSSALLWLF